MIRTALTFAVFAVALTAGGSSAQKFVIKSDEAKMARTLRGLTAGAPVHCIDRDRVTDIETYANTILYIQGRGKLWRANTTPGCRGLARGDLAVTIGPRGRYCTGDQVTTRARTGGFRSGSCSIDQLVPYSR